MRPLRSLLCYLVLVLAAGALLAPWLYWLTQWAAAHSPAVAQLAQHRFHRFVHRSLLVVALAGLWPLLRNLKVNSWAAVGLVNPAGHWLKLAGGFAVGFASLACVAMLTLSVGVRQLDPVTSPAALAGRAASVALTAAVVAVLEELLFRGAIFGALRRAHHWMAALLISSAVYALVHFFERPEAPPAITWASGVTVLTRMLHGFVNLPSLVPGFFLLALAGMTLAVAYQRTGNLYFSIGLHAGWIFWLKLYNAITTAQPGVNTWFWGTGKLFDGWLTLAVLAPVFLGVWHWPGKRPTALASGR